jgi:hypothetical protein
MDPIVVLVVGVLFYIWALFKELLNFKKIRLSKPLQPRNY